MRQADGLRTRGAPGGVREACEEDDGLRKCCGTRQLGPHMRACPLSPSFQQAVYDHERKYSHKTEV